MIDTIFFRKFRSSNSNVLRVSFSKRYILLIFRILFPTLHALCLKGNRRGSEPL